MPLKNNQKKFLRQAAHHLKPVVLTGQHGITDTVIVEIEHALERHELIKIKLRLGDKEARDEGIATICEQTNAEFVQRVGNILTIYKQNKDNPVISLPG